MFKRNLIISITLCFFVSFVNTHAQDYHCVLVGISAYQSPNQLPGDCRWDAQDMRSQLNTNYGWQLSNMTLLVDADGTSQSIHNSISALPRTSTNSDLFFFSGHGTTQGLLSVDENIISPSNLQSYFGSSYKYYTSFINTCHSGIFPSNMSNGVISSACSSSESSYTGGINGHCVWPAYLIQGLSNNIPDAEALHNYTAPLTTAYQSDMHPQLGDYLGGGQFFLKPYTTTGTISSNQTWIGNISLQGSISISSGATLTIKSGAIINLNGYTITTTGGTITLETGATITGLKAKLKSGSTIKGLFSSIQTAFNYASSNCTIEIQPGTYSDDITISGLNYFTISGLGVDYTTLTGTLSFCNCNNLQILALTAYGIYACYSNTPYFNCNISGLASQTGIDLYNCTNFSCGGNVYDFNTGINAASSSGGVSNYFVNNNTSVSSSSSSNVQVYYARLCESITYDFSVTSSGYISSYFSHFRDA